MQPSSTDWYYTLWMNKALSQAKQTLSASPKALFVVQGEANRDERRKVIVLSKCDRSPLTSVPADCHQKRRAPCCGEWPAHRNCHGPSCGHLWCSSAHLARLTSGCCHQLLSCNWTSLLPPPRPWILKMPCRREPSPEGMPQSGDRSVGQNN